MRLLVSVASADEVSAAVMGGADIIDAKDPAAGALGPVSVAALRAIVDAAGRSRPVSAAIGDALEESAIEHLAFEYGSAGCAFVKAGFAGIDSVARARALAVAARRGAAAGGSELVVAGYVDADRAADIAIDALVDVAAHAGARGVLLDTADKRGPGLPALLSQKALAAWVRAAHERKLFAAVAGKLTEDDLAFVADTGADIAGVRGAACVGGRAGRVSAEKVRCLRDLVRREHLNVETVR